MLGLLLAILADLGAWAALLAYVLWCLQERVGERLYQCLTEREPAREQ